MSHAIPYSALYVFGDSLSDTGNVFAATGGAAPPAPNYLGRFSNGPNYAEHFAAGLGLTATPSLLGGNNFAFGGAQSNAVFFPGTQSYLDQINAYQTRGLAPNPTALYLVNIGSNDLLLAMRDAALDPINATTIIQTAVTQLLNNVAIGLGQLDALGADHFIVSNLVDLGRTPIVTGFGSPALSAAARDAVQQYNAGLAALLVGLSVNNHVLGFDTFSLFEEFATTPPAGITNTTDACFSTSVFAPTLPGTVCADPGAYLFWDDLHPSARIHALSAERLLAAVGVPAPNGLALVMAGLLLWLCLPRKLRMHTR